MKPLTVVVTASGAPGTAALLHALRANGEREVRLVGTDMSERSVGRHLCDAFHLVPAGSDPAFPDAIREIAEREGAAAVLPQSSFDLEGLAGATGGFGEIAVLVSPPDAIHRSNDKAESYAFLRRLGPAGARLPPRPGRRRGRGGRARARLPGAPGLLQAGVLVRLARLPDPRPDRRPRRPAPARAARLGVDAARGGGRDPRLGRRPDRAARDGARDRARSGRSTGSRTAARSSSATRRPARRCAPASRCTSSRSTTTALMALSNAIVAELGIEHFFNIQLVGDYVIEINPRISTIVYQDDLNLPYLGVKRAIGEISDDELRALRPGSAPAGRRCATSTSSSSMPAEGAVPSSHAGLPPDMAHRDTSGDCPRTRPEQTCRFGSRTARSTSPGSRGRTSQALRRKGVDARLVVFNRGKLHPEADWSLDRHGGLPRRLATQFAALAKLLPQTDVFHFYFGLTLVPPSLQFPILQAARKKSVFHYLGSDIRGKTPAELTDGKRAGAEIVGSYAALRWVPEAHVVPPGLDLRPFTPVPPSRQPAPARRPRAVEPREEGHALRDRGLRAAPGRPRHRRGRPPRARRASATPAPTSSSTS